MSKNRRDYLMLITDNYPYGFGEEFIQNEVEFLSKSFKKIYVISNNRLDSQTKNIPENFEVFRLKKDYIKLFFMFNSLKKTKDFIMQLKETKNIKTIIKSMYNTKLIEDEILEIIKRDKLDLDEITLYSYWFHSAAYTISNFKYKFPQLRTVSRAHRYDLYKERGVQLFKNETLDYLDYLLPCSKQGEEYLKKNYGHAEKIKFSYLGTENKNEFKLKNDSRKLISCSYIRPVKRVNLILKALKELDTICPEIIWAHIGDGEEKKELELFAQENLKNIKFEFLGHMQNQEILDYYKNNDIKAFINLSSSEGLPVSMMEAQSFGIPIIATNVGGVAEIVNEEIGVLLKENPEISEVASAIKKILFLSEDEYEDTQKKCYENWKNKFNAEKNYKELINDYLKG